MLVFDALWYSPAPLQRIKSFLSILFHEFNIVIGSRASANPGGLRFI